MANQDLAGVRPVAGPPAADVLWRCCTARYASGRECATRRPMQTNFKARQLADPRTAQVEKILRTCVHCGLCTATCPTYVLLGDERDSPRGRIYLMKDMFERGAKATPALQRHIDRCLSCLSCMSTCPSGVDYMHLVDEARAHIETTGKRSL